MQEDIERDEKLFAGLRKYQVPATSQAFCLDFIVWNACLYLSHLDLSI